MNRTSWVRVVLEVVAVLLGLTFLLSSPLMIFGAHGVSSSADQLRGTLFFIIGLVLLFLVWYVEKYHPQQRQ